MGEEKSGIAPRIDNLTRPLLGESSESYIRSVRQSHISPRTLIITSQHHTPGFSFFSRGKQLPRLGALEGCSATSHTRLFFLLSLSISLSLSLSIAANKCSALARSRVAAKYCLPNHADWEALVVLLCTYTARQLIVSIPNVGKHAHSCEAMLERCARAMAYVGEFWVENAASESGTKSEDSRLFLAGHSS